MPSAWCSPTTEPAVPVLLLTGTCGSGKTALTAEIADVLAERHLPSAALDLDALIWQWPPSSPWNADLLFENLSALWPNYRAHGSTRLVLGRVLEDPSEIARYRAAVPGAEITVCRLTAPEALRIDRLRRRMAPGPALDWHLARTIELESILASLVLEDFRVENDTRSLRDVAFEVLVRAGWLPEGARA